jgi:hypothetical protein
MPVDVVQSQSADLDSSQAQPDKQQKHRQITLALRGIAFTILEQHVDVFGDQKSGNFPMSPGRDGWNAIDQFC